MRLLLAIAVAAILVAALFALAIHFNIPREFAAAFAAPLFAVVPPMHRRRDAVDAVFLAVAVIALAESVGLGVEYLVSEHPRMGFLLYVPPSLLVSVALLFLTGMWIGRRWAVVAIVIVALMIVRGLYDAYVVPPSLFGSAWTIADTARAALLQLVVWGIPLALGATTSRRRPSAETSYSAPR